MRALAKLTQLEVKQTKLATGIARAYGGALYPADMFVFAAVKRSLSLAPVFRRTIEEWNLLTARALLRLQLDTALRLSALWQAPDPHDLVIRLMAGEELRRHKSRDGRRMTDAYLVERLKNEYPWVESVYKTTSGYVHLSERQLFGAMRDVSAGGSPTRVTFALGSDDRHMPEGSWKEAVDCFNASTEILLAYLEGWLFTKDNPDLVERLRQTIGPDA